MEYKRLSIPDIVLITPKFHTDTRGSLYESYNAASFQDCIGRKVDFVQDNHSQSSQYVLRGLHYQVSPKSQGKIIRVTRGELFDVAVDLRRSSPSFGCWVGEILSAGNRRQMWIPEGFAHGFLALSADVEMVYKVTDFYAPEYERCLAWNDKEIGIDWPIPQEVTPLLSDKDKKGVSFVHADCFD